MLAKLIKSPVFILLLFTLIFRLWFAFSHLSLNQDFVRDIYRVQELQSQNNFFPGYGPKASVGDFYLPPFYYQLLLVLRVISTWPLLITVLTVFIESATPILLYILLKEFTKKNSAFFGAMLYAYSGLAITFGTFSWNPNMIPFFTTLSILLITKYHKNQKLWQLTAGILSIAIAFHLHYQVAVLLPFYIGFMLYQILKKKFNFYHWIIAVLVAIIPFIPYVRSEIMNNFTNTRQIAKYFKEEHSNYYDRVSKISYISTYLPSFVERELTKTNTPYLWVGRFIFFVGMFTLFKLTKRKKSFIVFIYFLSIIISLRLYKGDKLDYYLSTLFIFPAVLLAALAEKNKAIGLLLGLSIVFFSGFELSKVKTQNQFSDFEKSMKTLANNFDGNSARLIVHELDFANSILFGLSEYTDISVNQSSLNVIDVCRTGTDCISENIYCSKYGNNMNVYASLLRTTGHYSQSFSIGKSDLPFQIYVGKFENEPIKIAHPLSITFDRYGSDLLNKSIFQ